ncbi:MAG: hypothetical protein N838_07710 [Thiohalocapsa sp. PB-PSB1]|nr:MAG: hypothetical protein N838_07710 [Thiohalocapsa sp. PB-PSB1]
MVLLAGDEVVVTKSGKKTHGLDRFFPLWALFISSTN